MKAAGEKQRIADEIVVQMVVNELPELAGYVRRGGSHVVLSSVDTPPIDGNKNRQRAAEEE